MLAAPRVSRPSILDHIMSSRLSMERASVTLTIWMQTEHSSSQIRYGNRHD